MVGKGRVWWAEGTACAKGWGGCEKTPDPLACLWWAQEPAHSLAVGGGREDSGAALGVDRETTPLTWLCPWAHLCFPEPQFPHLNYEEVRRGGLEGFSWV